MVELDANTWWIARSTCGRSEGAAYGGAWWHVEALDAHTSVGHMS